MATAANELQAILIKGRNIGGYVFDAVYQEDHVSKLTITAHPVETGAAIADHAYLEPNQLTIQIGVSDVAYKVGDAFSDGPTRSINAYQLLRDIQSLRIPISVTTRLHHYSNMLIETIAAPDDYRTANALKATVTFKQVIVAQVRMVKISERKQITDLTQRGTVEPAKPSETVRQSWLYQMSQIGGGR
jgi:hypothetical protein